MENSQPGDYLELEDDPSIVTKLDKFHLLGKILSGKTIKTANLYSIVKNSWDLKRKFSIAEGENIFLFSFDLESDSRRTLDLSPWTVIGSLMPFKKWSDQLTLEEISFDSCAFWIRVLNLPPAKKTTENLLKIGSLAGRILEVDDSLISSPFKRNFLRARVEVDMSNSLKTGFFLQLRELPAVLIQFQYERLNGFCTLCGVIEHEKTVCPIFRYTLG